MCIKVVDSIIDNILPYGCETAACAHRCIIKLKVLATSGFRASISQIVDKLPSCDISFTCVCKTQQPIIK